MSVKRFRLIGCVGRNKTRSDMVHTSRYLDKYFVRGDSCPSTKNCALVSFPALLAAAVAAMTAATCGSCSGQGGLIGCKRVFMTRCSKCDKRRCGKRVLY